MSSIFKKTALAVAVSATMVAPAMSADLAFSGGDGTVVLANIIFGDGAPGAGSDETLIVAPESTFTLVEAAGNNNGDLITFDGVDGFAGDIGTVKFTLGGGAVFGEDLSTTVLADAANAGAGVFSLTAAGGVDADASGAVPDAADISYEVVQGGAIGDNTITFEIRVDGNGSGNDITIADTLQLQSVTFDAYKVKNLQSVLNPNSVSPKVFLGVEYVEIDVAGADAANTDADDVTLTSTDTPLLVLGSQDPLTLTGTVLDIDGVGVLGKHRINVADSEIRFTVTAPGNSDFTSPGIITQDLGTITLSRNNIDTGTNAFPLANAGVIKKENGDDFDFQGGDSHLLTLNGIFSAYTSGTGSMFLGTDNTCSVAGMLLTGTSNVASVAAGVATWSLVGDTNALEQTYHVCVTADGTTAISEESVIQGAWTVDYFNTRYDNNVLATSDYGPILRNGCIASFFNVPPSDNANDTAFIRLSNTSSTNNGDIRGTLYAQDGTVLGTDVTVAPDLAIHATQVFTSMAADVTTAHGETLISLENAFSIAPADYKGRGRLVLKGAFDTCEGLGLIRNASTGALYNMTSTTQGNEAAAPNDGNNGQ